VVRKRIGDLQKTYPTAGSDKLFVKDQIGIRHQGLSQFLSIGDWRESWSCLSHFGFRKSDCGKSFFHPGPTKNKHEIKAALFRKFSVFLGLCFIYSFSLYLYVYLYWKNDR